MPSSRNPNDYTDQERAHQHAEVALIGHVFWQPDNSLRIFERIKNPDVFKSWLNRQIYKAYLHISGVGEPINSASVMRYFEEVAEKKPTGVLPYLLKASDVAEADIYTEQAIDQHINIVLEAHYMQKFRELSRRAHNMADIQRLSKDVLDWSITEIPSQRTPAVIVNQLINRQELIYDGSVKAGYSWGLDAMDRILHLRPGYFYTLGGLKKSGKTLFALSLLEHNLREAEPAPCLVFSMEMSDEALFGKLFSSVTGVNSRLIHTKYLPRDQFDLIKEHVDEMSRIPLTVDDQATMTITDVVIRSRGWKFKNNIPDGSGIIVVDFMQLLQLEGKRNDTTAELLKNAAYQMTRMAKELKVAVVALAQLRNEAEGHVPHIRFLEGSGGIAQASEGILLLDLYKRRDANYESGSAFDDIDIHITQRSGMSETKVRCQVDLKTGRFYERVEDPWREERVTPDEPEL